MLKVLFVLFMCCCAVQRDQIDCKTMISDQRSLSTIAYVRSDNDSDCVSKAPDKVIGATRQHIRRNSYLDEQEALSSAGILVPVDNAALHQKIPTKQVKWADPIVHEYVIIPARICNECIQKQYDENNVGFLLAMMFMTLLLLYILHFFH